MNLQCMITKAARMLNSDSLDREGGGKGIAMSACQSSDEPKRNKESNLRANNINNYNNIVTYYTTVCLHICDTLRHCVPAWCQLTNIYIGQSGSEGAPCNVRL